MEDVMSKAARLRTAGFALVLMTAWAWPAASETRHAPSAKPGEKIELHENEMMRTIDCQGGEVVRILGNENFVRVEDAIVSVETLGNENVVHAEGPIKSIKMLGNENLATWSRAANAARPRVSILGNENLCRARGRVK
jgi:hypothetical protein